MLLNHRINRMEVAGSLGDLGTLLPIAMAMILINGLNPVGLFFSIGVFYIIAGLYFGVTVPVQPMKVIGAYAIATAMSPSQILASSLLMGLFLLIIGLTGAIELVRKYTPKPVVRGVQFSTGALLITSGVKFMTGTSSFQTLQAVAEPYLRVQSIGPVQIGIVIGLIGGFLTLLLLENKRFPAGLIIILAGLLAGLVFGARLNFGWWDIGFSPPKILPFPFPETPDFTFALFALVLPQLPMTLGNAVLAYTDLSREYFEQKSVKVTNRKVCVSMALANFLSFLVGGMPLCHGAGGLAAHYRFGARTAGSNLVIGVAFALFAIILGNHIVSFFNLIPMAVLGVLLIFAGSQLALTVIDLRDRKDWFVVVIMLGITLASNLAVGFIVGIALGHLIKWEKLSI